MSIMIEEQHRGMLPEDRAQYIAANKANDTKRAQADPGSQCAQGRRIFPEVDRKENRDRV